METGNEKVCRRCGTLNHEKSLMCVRCGETLEMTEDKKYEIFKGDMMSEKLFLILFIILFTAYSFALIFYVGPWISSHIALLSNSYIFEFYNNPNLTKISLEVLYAIAILLINLLSITIIIDCIINNKLLKRVKVISTYIIMFIYMLLSFIAMTIYKNGIDYIIIIQHFISILVVLPNIKRKLLRRSV